MRAIEYFEYGSPEVLQLTEVDKPIPKDREVLIRIMATAVNSADWRLRKADPFAVRFILGLRKPKKNILGGVFSGVIESVGKYVTLYSVGDEVFGSAAMHFGAYAEYVCLPENCPMARKPVNISHPEAAVIPFGATAALHFLRKASIRKGQKVLIYGASGAIGTAAVQLAKYYGAHVTGVCSTANIDLVKTLGADQVVDYTKDDFTKNGETYDVIFETVNKITYSQSLESLTKEGELILAASGLTGMIRGLWTSMTSNRKVFTGVISENARDMMFLKKLIEESKLKPVIDRTYALEQMVEAHTYVEQGHKKGNVAIIIAEK